MTTPRKNFEGLESPYAKHMLQYPSQSEGYLPFDLGGPGSCLQNKESEPQHRRYTSTPAKYNNHHNRGNNRMNEFNAAEVDGNFFQNRHNHNWRGRGRSSFYVDTSCNIEGGQHRQQNQRNNGFGYRRGGNGHQYQNNKYNKDGTAAYFHPSMLEDPWKDLMKRHNAIQNSRIEVQKHDPENDIRDSSSDGDSDNEAEKNVMSDDPVAKKDG